MSDDLIQRVRRLEDLTAIHELFIAYGRYLDAGDLDSYAGLFTDDGEVLLGPLGRAKGRDDIKALMAKALAGREGTSYHLITSPTVTLDGDRATATVMWTVIDRGPDGAPVITMVGHHADVLTRVAEGWRFQQRKGFIDLPSRFPTT
ncbi:MAG: nuclear transport factor 2 family protein [Acidimicrobiales bacterium]